MSRIAKHPIVMPRGVKAEFIANTITISGGKGKLTYKVPTEIEVVIESESIKVKWNPNDSQCGSKAGTARAILNNMVTGVNDGYERKLQLFGVGYRAQAKGDELSLSLGFSHPINYRVPSGVTIDTPIPTEIIIKGIDKQLVGQVAANIRAYRPPEPYKGKGVRYYDEKIVKKEAKKK